jgi:membrane protein DedA with SNARE-associated domain
MPQVEEFLTSWGYLGIFLGIIATGAGFPMPEELPVVLGGVLAGHFSGQDGPQIRWWVMLPVCIVGVIIGDSILYFIGRLWGPRVLKSRWVQKHVLGPERLASIEQNFQLYGVRILLFARLTPGIRAPIFMTAGIIRLPLSKFVLADGLYAVPGVSILFGLGYMFGDSIIALVHRAERVKFYIMVAVLAGIALYMTYRFLRKPIVTGDPHEMPPLVEHATDAIHNVTSKIMHPMSGHSHHGEAQGPEIRDQRSEVRDQRSEHRAS